ncbi:glycosyltransferase [Marilutibacter chinensis]|uniref:Glycosyltransferase n=1 Tax=Marilutibacter chinensis TaxID=2912247 RepID=A0ABS9HXB4_9GAMM|nr:glycosyltransferase [Lysobacter chinensis]MCF7221818.1 glycosyltransferase [Lysobacter chinensis]MCF7222963.1 glycosyltransferase [Lysobacter chinensis]
MDGLRVAVLVPCFNEEATVAQVVVGMKSALPTAEIHVFDNNSTDATVEQAGQAGAVVHRVGRRGKGNVVRRQFSDVEADVYVLVDGDATYHAASAPALVAEVVAGNDMVVGVRESSGGVGYRPGHAFGNRLLTTFLSRLFGHPCRDILSGYRAFSRRFVKSFPAHSSGFEIETELTVHALELRMPVAEVDTPYVDRPEGSVSKLNTWSDGARILRTMLRLFSSERPMAFYGTIAAVLSVVALALCIPLAVTYLDTGLVPRFPTLILAVSLVVLASMSALIGIVIDAVARGRRELKTMAYLQVPAPCRELRVPGPVIQERMTARFANTNHGNACR